MILAVLAESVAADRLARHPASVVHEWTAVGWTRCVILAVLAESVAAHRLAETTSGARSLVARPARSRSPLVRAVAGAGVRLARRAAGGPDGGAADAVRAARRDCPRGARPQRRRRGARERIRAAPAPAAHARGRGARTARRRHRAAQRRAVVARVRDAARAARLAVGARPAAGLDRRRAPAGHSGADDVHASSLPSSHAWLSAEPRSIGVAPGAAVSPPLAASSSSARASVRIGDCAGSARSGWSSVAIALFDAVLGTSFDAGNATTSRWSQ